MRLSILTVFVCAAAAVLSGCAALRPAQMKLPGGLAAHTEPGRVTGLGGGTRGTFQLAGNGGSFTRSASRLALFDDLAVIDRGGAGFTIAGPDFAQPVSARCVMRQTTMQIRVIAFTPKKLAYECDFDGAAARLSLQEAAGSALGRAERRGELVLDGITLTMRSVHDLVGSSLAVQAPIGYVIEYGGQPIAAVELNGTEPQLRLPSNHSDQRRAALLAALALALLWDPAAS